MSWRTSSVAAEISYRHEDAALRVVRYEVVKIRVLYKIMQASQTLKHRERLDKIYFLWYNDKSCIKTHTNSILTKSARCSCICLITRYKLSPNFLCLVGVLILLPFYYTTFFMACQPHKAKFLKKNLPLMESIRGLLYGLD